MFRELTHSYFVGTVDLQYGPVLAHFNNLSVLPSPPPRSGEPLRERIIDLRGDCHAAAHSSGPPADAQLRLQEEYFL